MPDQSELVSSARQPQLRAAPSASGMAVAAQVLAPPRVATGSLTRTPFMAERQARRDPTVGSVWPDWQNLKSWATPSAYYQARGPGVRNLEKDELLIDLQFG